MRTHPPAAARGLTPKEAAGFLRISHNRVRALIRSGALGAVNTGTAAKPRFVILPEHVTRFVQTHAASPPAKPKRRKPTRQVDFYP